MSAVALKLPVEVLDHPHWRVLYRPRVFQPERVSPIRRCVALVESNAVSFRGWDFPHLSSGQELVIGKNSIEAWCDFMSHLEYWRFFQSGQFIYLGAVREVRDKEWRAQLLAAATHHLERVFRVRPDNLVGCFSITNFVYTVSEYFEFAARLCQAGVYGDGIDVTIELKRVQGIGLCAEFGRAWYNANTISNFGSTWSFEAKDLLGATSDAGLQAAKWFIERLGWLNVSVDALRGEQEKLYQRRH